MGFAAVDGTHVSPSLVRPSPKSEGSNLCSRMTLPVCRSVSLTVDCPYIPAQSDAAHCLRRMTGLPVRG